MKKAAPAKESGLYNMQPDTNSFDMTTHMDFGLDQLLPMIVGYAKGNGHPTQAALVASFLILTTAMHANGVTRDEIDRLVDTACPSFMAAPEGLQ